MNKPEGLPNIYEQEEAGTSQWRQPYPTDGLTTDLASTNLQTRFKTITQSPVFDFLVGPERKPMSIHKALVAAQSAVLRDLVTGSTEEANSGKMVWEDVDEDTFALFAEFAYTGDYAKALKSGLEYDSGCGDDDETDESDCIYDSAPKHSSRPSDFWDEYGHIKELATNKDDANNEADSPEGSEDDEKNWEDYDSDESESDGDYPPEEAMFQNLRFKCPVDPIEAYGTYFTQSPDEQRITDCKSFLSHARIYVLADKYDMPHLKNVAVRKLQKALDWLMPIEEDFHPYIADLIKFIYGNTPSLGSTRDPLRELVTHFVAHPELRLFTKSKCCVAMMRECEPFAVDLWKTLIKRSDRAYFGPG
ncbi:hypothetical protein MMC31_004409 [Peltigera leucophlebia]|nr:hypothetical protein [Peltigera leucophlebia]